MQPGERRTFKHDCGGGRKLLISRDARGWAAWCFRCADSGWAPAPGLSVRESRQRQARLTADVAAVAAHPQPLVADVSAWPERVAVWFYQMGLSRFDLGRLGVGYHPPTERAVVPVLDPFLGTPVWWTARAFDGRQPKWLSAAGRCPILPEFGPLAGGGPITLVEDLLSAYKVGLVGRSLCLLGTHMHDKVLARLLEHGAPVNLWLDPDSAGQLGARRISKRLNALGLSTRVIHSLDDPKMTDIATIKELLS